MPKRFAITAVVLALALSWVAYSTPAGSQPNSTLPELSLDKPAVGFTMEVQTGRAKYTVGEDIMPFCTIVNTTDQTLPLGWSPTAGKFVQQEDEAMVFRGGIARQGLACFDSPILVKTAPGLEHRDEFILYLPPGSSVRFMIRIGPADEPGTFKGRLVYDPLARWGGGPYGARAAADERHIFSNVFEYEVVAATPAG